MIRIDPIEVFFWNIRHNEKDVVQIYDKLAPLMQLGANSSTLNFGLWNNDTKKPLDAQKKMCQYVSDFGSFQSSKRLLDVGSGYGTPALFWKNNFPALEIVCMNLNFGQLNQETAKKNLNLVNCIAKSIPFADCTFDRIVALESAHHFKRLGAFFRESRRLISDDGIVILAMPAIKTKKLASLKLGILNLTWTSLHYSRQFVEEGIKKAGFEIQKAEEIGTGVYEPLADYYLKNRERLRECFSGTYSGRVEGILFRSMKKMQQLSREKVIEYFVMRLVPS